MILAATTIALTLATPASPSNLDRFFPFRLGDSWTYDWTVAEGERAPRKLTRTRVFDGTEFIGAGLAYKLVSDDGSYHLYTFEKGVLAIHSSSEGGRLYFYEPPLVLAAPDFKVGETRVVEHKDTGRTWKTTLLGFEDVTVPLGTFKDALKIRLTMESPEFSSDSLHYFAPDVGLVAYRYELQNARTKRNELRIDAQLRLARLAGAPITKVADVAKLSAGAALDLAGRDDPGARDALRRALDSRYTWDAGFPGFRGDFEYVEEEKPAVRGSFVVERDLTVKIEAPSEAARAVLRNEISSFVSHRKESPFDLTHGGVTFKKGATGPAGELEVIAQGDPTGARHTVSGDDLLKVERSVGRLRYVATYVSTARTEDGRRIAVEYELSFFSNEDGSEISSEHIFDSYARVGAYWLPTGRRSVKSTRGEKASSFELHLTNLRP